MSFLSTVLADSPIRGYRLDDATKTNGSSVVDSGSQAQNGTVSGSGLSSASSLLTSDSDGATTFGSSSYITMPTTGLPTGAGAWSVEAWINMPSLPGSGFATVVHFGTASGNLQSLQIYYRASPSRFDIWGWSSLIVNSTGVTPTAGATYQLVVTYDGSSVVTLYINGVSNTSASGVTMNLVEAAAQIGNDTAGDFFTGVVDEVWFFPSTLNSTRVAAHYSAGTATTNTRTVPASAALLQTSTRTVPATTALLATTSRSIPASAALLQTSSRSLSAAAALLQTNSRSVPANAALLSTSARAVPASGALLQTSSRTVGTSASLLATSQRTVPAYAALSGISIIKYNANVFVRSGVASALVRSGQASLIVRE